MKHARHQETRTGRIAATIACGAIAMGSMTTVYAQPGPDGEALAKREPGAGVTLERLREVYPGMTEESFATLDTNGDGVLNRQDEAGPRRGRPGSGMPPRGPHGPERMHQRADANKDGDVTFDELKAVRPEVTEEVFKQRDTNGDGVLNRADRPERVGRRGDRGPEGDVGPGPDFRGRRGGGERGPGMRGPNGRGDRGRFMAKADTDGDGGVSLEELRAVRPDMTEEGFKQRDTNGDGVINRADRPQRPEGNRPPRGAHGRDGAPAGPPPMIEKADTNGDGEVSREEWIASAPEWAGEWFDRMDRNGDGVLNADDRPQHRLRRGTGPNHGPRGPRN